MKDKVLMIVDDDADDRQTFKDAVYEIDRTIICLLVCNGQDALRLLNQAKYLPDYIFLDLNMPRINGHGCITKFKTNSRLQHIPVIVYSSSKNPLDIEEASKAGAVKFITKPPVFVELKEALRKAIS